MGSLKRLRPSVEGYLFIAPAALVIGLFGIFPVFFTLFVSLHKWRIKRGSFLGLQNYQEVFGNPLILLALLVGFLVIWAGVKMTSLRSSAGGTAGSAWMIGGLAVTLVGLAVVIRSLPGLWAAGDTRMFDSLRVTIWYSLGAVPVQLALGLFLAVMLDSKFKGKQAFRVIFLLPYIVPSVASATVFERLFSLRPESFANQVLLLFGAEPMEWLRDSRGIFEILFGWGTNAAELASETAAYWALWAQGPSLALMCIVFFNYWVFIGYYALIYANGLANIPRQLYEAAEIDGASRLQVFSRIIIPMLSPTTFFLSLLGIIGTFKAFNHIYVLRDPTVRGAADTMSLHIFFTFFRKSRFGYAAAMALVLFVIVLSLTVLQRRIMAKRVFYGE